ncbi:MAG TPA: HK97 gp10 family phage protein [Armatimonadota bacterium]|nr:HK97 gp10 family phage protein [Armatimonadota bacterium]
MKRVDREVEMGLARAQAGMRAAVEDALLECAEAIAEEARADCPVRSGRLRASIGVEVCRAPEDGIIEARVSASAPYAAAVELGLGKVAPRPFLFPALERWGPALARRVRDLALRG